MPRCLIIAGPNGAGKTTFAMEYLPAIGVRHFLNADLIATGLSPLDPDKGQAVAARLFLERRNECVKAFKDFAIETTLSGQGYIRFIERLKKQGWTVELYYLALPDAEMSKSRVAERVAHGGHNIPDVDIERRFPRSLRNLFIDYSRLVDYCICFIDSESKRHVVFERDSRYIRIGNEAFYEKLLTIAGLYGTD